MAQVTVTLMSAQRPAFHALMACAAEIAITHGEEAAVDWAQQVLGADFDLFVRVSAQQPRPHLRVITGGA